MAFQGNSGNYDSNTPTPLTKLGGLFESKKGNALTGNVNLNYMNRQTQRMLGDVLIDEIRQAMKMNHAWRILVFENSGKSGAPYSIHTTISDRPNREPGSYQGDSPSQGEPPPPRTQTPTYTTDDPTQPDPVEVVPDWVDPTPRRRTAPRR